MSGGAAQFAISAAAVITGGSAVQLIVALVRRRSDMANVDATTEKIRAEAERVRTDLQAVVAAQLAAEATRQGERSLVLEKRIDGLQRQLVLERQDCDRRIADELERSSGLTREIAVLRHDLANARCEIAALKTRIDAAQ